jgi:cobaltochelatase CobN
MHLLLSQKGSIADGDEAIDLGQTPGDILFLSAADTELAAIASAKAASGAAHRSVRVASLMILKHPMSVDTYIERTARHARLILVRALGGASYFAYVLDALLATAAREGIALVVLPGDDKPDPGLDRYSTVTPADRNALWAFLNEGGAENARGLLDYAAAMVDGAPRPGEAVPLMRAGVWAAPVSPHPKPVEATGRRGIAAIVFYRALVQSGQTAPVEPLIAALTARGLAVTPIFVSSLKDPVSIAAVERSFADTPPDVVINATGFAVSAPGGATQGTVLESTGAPVLQVVFSGSARSVWEASAQGLSARDLAMHVALPEVDGRVLSRAVSFKSAERYDETVEANIVAHEPLSDRIDFVADLAANWARLRRTAPKIRRVAIVLANYPNRDGRLGNGVGLDTPAGTIEVLRAIQGAGYSVDNLPTDGDGLITALMAGPTNAAVDAREIRETMALNDYKTFFATLPASIQEAAADAVRRDGRRHPACARLQYRSEGNLPRAGSRAAAWIHRLLCLAAHGLWCPCRRPHGQARQSRMAARQGAGAF